MCKCGCGTCETKITGPLLTESKVKSLLSEGLNHHISNAIPLHETVYRYGSVKHLSLIKEARKLYSRNVIDLNEFDAELVKTHLGEWGLFEGESIPLDLPMLNEALKTGTYAGKKVVIHMDGAETDWQVEFENGKKVSYIDLMANLKFDDGTTYMDYLNEAKKKKSTKKDPPIGKPKRGGSKAYYVYVRDPKTKKIKKVSFGSGGLRAKINNPKARNAFAKRHRCSTKNDRTKPGYWSCRLPRYAKALGLGNNKNTFW